MKHHLPLALLLLGASMPAGAQTTSRAEDPHASLLEVVSTDPKLFPCSSWGSESCFRVTLRISAKGGREIDVGYIPDNGFYRTRAARAFSGTGSSCIEKGGVGLPPVVVWSSGKFTWREPGYRLAGGRVATLMLEFGCDARLVPGDELMIQFSIAVDPDGRQIETARYSLSGLHLAGSAGVGRRR
jgi:hypothetical protein